MKNSGTQAQYTAVEQNNQLVLILNSEIKLPEDAPVRVTSAQLEELDYRKLYAAYSSRGRKSVTDPRVIFKVMAYGYQCGIFFQPKVGRSLPMMKEDHMRKGQLKPAYNVQIAVNSEYITGIEAFSNWTDVGTFIPFMRKLELAHQQRYEEVATDAGYESLDNYLYLEANGQMSFIKPTNGKRNIRIELFFLALGFNLKKRWMKQQKSRLETHYSEKKAS